MDVLVLGGSGFVGRHLTRHLASAGMRPQAASRHGNSLYLDTCDSDALTAALHRCDAVVNAVAGSARAMDEGARLLAQALRQVGGRPLVHLSSLAVYAEADARAGIWPEASWMPGSAAAPVHTGYARAKRAAEAHLAVLAREGLPVSVLRPGCVWGPGSPLWVTRIADLLAAGRLGDLGAAGDGWTQGVHVQDLCEAVLRLLQSESAGAAPRVYNLAAPDSPRWNHYLRDLALAIGAKPVRRLPAWQLALDGWVAGPPLYLAQRLGGARRWPPLTPSLLRLMRGTACMETFAAQSALGLRWTSYERALEEAADAWRTHRRASASRSARARNSGLPAR